MVMDVIVHKLNSSAARTVLQRHLDPTMLDAHVQQANMDVVRMVSTMHKDHNLMDAMIFQGHHKRHAAFQKIKELAAIIRLNTSSIWIMAVVHDSGIADVVVTRIASKQMKIVKIHAFNRAAKMYAKYQKFMAHAMDISKNIITIRIGIFAHHSFMVVAWAIQIVSTQWKNAKNNVLLMNHCVSDE